MKRLSLIHRLELLFSKKKFCYDCNTKIHSKNWGVQGFSPEGVESNYCCDCIVKMNKEAILKEE